MNLQDKIKSHLHAYDADEPVSSDLFPTSAITYLKQVVLQPDIDSTELIQRLLQHKWTLNKITATDICVAMVLGSASDGITISRIYRHDFTKSVKFLSENGLLANVEEARKNLGAITEGNGLYAEYIAQALRILQSASLLTGDSTQANRAALTLHGGIYAISIEEALRILQSANLLTGDSAQANFNTITQNRGRYSWDISKALVILERAALLTEHNAQTNFNAITQGGGQYAESMAHGLVILQSANLLTGNDAQTNRDAISQGGGQYAQSIAEALVILQSASLLTGDGAQANRDAITRGSGQYAGNIADALGVLQRAHLLTGPNAQANFNAITQGGGRCAQGIAHALGILQSASLLTGPNAQANFNALTQGGGQYAKSIADALLSLQNASLLTADQGQRNFDRICQRIVIAASNSHGCGRFLELIEVMAKNNALSQDSFNLFFEADIPSVVDGDSTQQQLISIVNDNREWHVFSDKVQPYLSSIVSKDTLMRWRHQNPGKSASGLVCEILQLCEFIPDVQLPHDMSASELTHSLLDCMLFSSNADLHFLLKFLSQLKKTLDFLSDPLVSSANYISGFLTALNIILVVLTWAEKEAIENASATKLALMQVIFTLATDDSSEEDLPKYCSTVTRTVEQITQLVELVVPGKDFVAAISTKMNDIRKQLGWDEPGACEAPPTTARGALGSTSSLIPLENMMQLPLPSKESETKASSPRLS